MSSRNDPSTSDESYSPTRVANLSAVDAKLDARANPVGDRPGQALQQLEKLVVQGLPRPPVIVKAGESIKLGRIDACDVVISADHRISRVHCEIECRSKDAVLRDLQSTNGTYLNGERIKSANLFDNDRVVIGGTVLVIRVVSAS